LNRIGRHPGEGAGPALGERREAEIMIERIVVQAAVLQHASFPLVAGCIVPTPD